MCKSGKIDCMTGAALAMMDYSGTIRAGHLKQTVIDMIHRAETLYGCSLAAFYEGHEEASGTFFIDPVLANASKIHEGREMAEAHRITILRESNVESKKNAAKRLAGIIE